MYLGSVNSYGIRRLVKMLIAGYLEDVTGLSAIEITFNPDNHISIIISGATVDELLHEIAFLQETNSGKNFKTALLVGISRTLLIRIVVDTEIHMLASHSGVYEITNKVASGEPNGIKVDFQLDTDIFKTHHVAYVPMNIMLQQMAYLNAGLKIISVDNRGELQRNVFYFRTGITELFNDLLDKHDYGSINAWLPIELKTAINGYILHIILRYHNIYTTYPAPYIRSFANNESTKRHGSLVDGILKGLEDAFLETAVKTKADLKINKKRVGKHLVLFAAVKGEPLTYAGSGKDQLDMPPLKKEVRKYVKKAVLKYLEEHAGDRKRVLEKFRKKD
jgi:DNA gyrase/topoisomerase IV subunit B